MNFLEKNNLWGSCIKSIPQEQNETPVLYLTFDDGPHPYASPRVLEVLDRNNIKATFFMVAKKASLHRVLAQYICQQGHGVGNHSLDHGYRVFFQGRKKMFDWIKQSEDLLQDVLGRPTCGFRSPAGIRTPELHWALNELGIPLVHWRWRFFDTVFYWTIHRAARLLPQLANGDIILLHESSCLKSSSFLETLDWFIKQAVGRGFKFKIITPACVGKKVIL